MSPPNIYLIDAIGPFFRGYKKKTINWSKIPWRRIQKLTGKKRRIYFAQVAADLEVFCARVAGIGYTAISLDDLPHLADHEFYSPKIRDQILKNQTEFRRLFKIVGDAGLHIFLTMDVMTFTRCTKERLGTSESKIHEYLGTLLNTFFKAFPEVSGLIIRIGESDGKDVNEDFRSRLTLKNPTAVNRFLKEILPVFDKHKRTCIFRTWTVGAHQVGDLIWRDATLTKTVQGIESPALILSMKYGESDFFRYLSLNRNFFVTNIPTIIELQTRREYEGCGEYPSFVGHDYEQFALELRSAPNFVGISVWCQTGGWTPFRRLAFIENTSIWTEINTFVTLRIFRDNKLWEEAVTEFPGCKDESTSWIELLRLSEEVVKELLYVPEFASQKMFFRRVRIPPLIGVYWHNIFIAHAIKRMLTHFVEDGEACIRGGYAALEKIRRMKELAELCHLPADDIDFMEDTFSILALAREYFFTPTIEAIDERLTKAKRDYKAKYAGSSRHSYAVKINLTPFNLEARHLSLLMKYLIRDQPRYRLIDKIIGLRLLSYFYFILKRTRPKMIPKFARKSAMGIDSIFR